MNMQWTCPHCGGNTYYYHKTGKRFRCYDCGSAVERERSESEERYFIEKIELAQDQLDVENWSRAKRIVNDLRYERPKEEVIYRILLEAETKGYSDLALEDSTARTNVEAYWSKLCILGGINTEMRMYAIRRKEFLDKKRKEFVKKQSIFIPMIVISVFMTVLLYALGYELATFILLIPVTGFFFYAFDLYKDMKLLKCNLENPFT